MSALPPTSDPNAPAPVPPPGVPPAAPVPAPEQSKLGLVAMIVAIIGFIFGVIPGAFVIGWILLPIAFILSIVALFQKGKKTKAVIALIVTIVGFVASGIAFLMAVDSVVTEVLDEMSSETQIVEQDEVVEVADGDSDTDVDTDSETAAEESTDSVGTRNNPALIGDEIVTDEWTIVVNSITPDATEEIIDASAVNSEPEDGFQYLLANLTATYTGEEKGNTLEISVAFVSSSGEVYNSSDSFVVAPEPQFLMDELYTDASDTGNVAIAIPTGAEGALRVSPGFFADEVFVALN